ncbi:MAG: hypothetical protein GY864_06515 [Desulfobacterales bacterium]|nr:hypothetical protein [Desulfobacterales bacterium]
MKKAAFNLMLIIILSTFAFPCSAGLIHPGDLVYKGAFRLPAGSNSSNWEWSGGGMTYYPDGDPSGPADGYPGSIYGIGHDWHYHVSEISIPTPIISSNLDDLNTATTLQQFQDITNGIFEGTYFELYYGDIEYLPARGSQTTGKLHVTLGQHNEDDNNPTHMWCELDLSRPQTAGAWHFGNYTPYTTNDYLFEIPQAWATANTPGQLLATGRFREGVWGGRGPALFAYGPWNDGNPPAPNATLTSLTPLLLYGTNSGSTVPITTSSEMEMDNFSEADEWTGGAWLTSGNKSALIFAGTKGIGNSWYGFADGTTTWPPVPPAPNDSRGYWADSYKRRIIFYDPADLAAVANGAMNTYEPQPYAYLDIEQYLHNALSGIPRYDQEGRLGAVCFDRSRGLLYVFERRVEGDKSLVHVWEIDGSSPGPACMDVDSNLSFTIPCADYNGIQYSFELDFYNNPDDPSGLYWELDLNTLTSGNDIATGCLSISDELSLTVPCVVYNGVQYGFKLDYYYNPIDPSGIYWKMDIDSATTQTRKMGLDDVRTWAYNIQDVDSVQQRNELVGTHFDLYVLEPVVTEEGNENFDIASLVQDIRDHNTTTRNVDPIILAYMDVGQAESWRWYYDDSWIIGDPEWIVAEDPDDWEGCYPVAYWYQSWQDMVIYGHQGRSMVEESLKGGFDGIYMDWVEAFSDDNVIAKANNDDVVPSVEMFNFIENIRDYARLESVNADPDYLIIAQNASDLYVENPARYRQIIDAIALEGIWYDGTGGFDNWNDPTGYNVPTNNIYTGYTEEVLANLEPMKPHMPIFCVEYAQDLNGKEYASEVYNTLAPAQGFIPYCTRRSLARLSKTPYPSDYEPLDY